MHYNNKIELNCHENNVTLRKLLFYQVWKWEILFYLINFYFCRVSCSMYAFLVLHIIKFSFSVFFQESVLHWLWPDPEGGTLRYGRPKPHQTCRQQNSLPSWHHSGPGQQAGVLGRRLSGLHWGGGLRRQEPAHHHSGFTGTCEVSRSCAFVAAKHVHAVRDLFVWSHELDLRMSLPLTSSHMSFWNWEHHMIRRTERSALAHLKPAAAVQSERCASALCRAFFFFFFYI